MNPKAIQAIEVDSVLNLSEALGRVAASLFIHHPTIDTLVTGMAQAPGPPNKKEQPVV